MFAANESSLVLSLSVNPHVSLPAQNVCTCWVAGQLKVRAGEKNKVE